MTHFKLTINFDRGSYVGTSSVRGRGRRRGADPELEASGSLAVRSSESFQVHVSCTCKYVWCKAISSVCTCPCSCITIPRWLRLGFFLFALLGNGLARDDFSVADGWYGCDRKPYCCERGGRRGHSSSATAVGGACRKGRAFSRRGI